MGRTIPALNVFTGCMCSFVTIALIHLDYHGFAITMAIVASANLAWAAYCVLDR